MGSSLSLHRNADNHYKPGSYCLCLQTRLLEEQQGLQDRLKKALQLHLHPKTSVDTTTVADKIVSLFDEMLQVSMHARASEGPCFVLQPRQGMHQ